MTIPEEIKKTPQSGLHEKHRLIQPKFFQLIIQDVQLSYLNFTYLNVQVSFIQVVFLYLSIIHKPVSNSSWYKNVSMGQHTINSIMKKVTGNFPLRNSDRKLANHNTRKSLVKKLRQNYIPNSEIIDITGHNSEAGLDAYNSGNKEQQRAISNAIDTDNIDPAHFQKNLFKTMVHFVK